MLAFMSLCCILLCSGASVGIAMAAMVHQPDLSSHQTERERRALVSPLEPRSDGFIATFPESRGGCDLLAFMSLCYILLCSGASAGIAKAALVHQPDLSSHRTARDRRAGERFGLPS